MYLSLLIVHNLVRWLILLAGFTAVALALVGLFGKKPWNKGARIAGLAYVGLFDLQLLLGLGLYAISPIVHTAMSDVGGAMKSHVLRFFLVEHAFGMLVALILAHVGSVLVKKATTDGVKYRHAAIFYGISLLIVLGSIPWFRPLFRF